VEIKSWIVAFNVRCCYLRPEVNKNIIVYTSEVGLRTYVMSLRVRVQTNTQSVRGTWDVRRTLNRKIRSGSRSFGIRMLVLSSLRSWKRGLLWVRITHRRNLKSCTFSSSSWYYLSLFGDNHRTIVLSLWLLWYRVITVVVLIPYYLVGVAISCGLSCIVTVFVR